ncbi:MAG: sodium:proton antiporter [Ferruginibacter sp.]|nr:sodium:proton antiporter [Ferruginibacter sp.]
MTIAVIITLCVLILIAYLFDVTAAFTKIPSVILLLALGWLVKQLSVSMEIDIPNLSAILPILGTVGLILIVLEGSLELELNKSKIPLVKKSFLVAVIPMLVLAFSAAAIISLLAGYDYKTALTNVIPLCVISSSIAIPSAKRFSSYNKEFVTYESSMSDILGVIFFNFIGLNASINAGSFGIFFLQIIVIVIVSFVATALLALLLSRIEHDIKFVPIILLIILIYEVSKIFHLPSLVFILVFGLFLGNLDELRHVKWLKRFKPNELNKEAHKFLGFIMEITFLIRALFFLLFGYLIDTQELLNINSLSWSACITAGIYLTRAAMLKLSRLPVRPLLFVAPRGLINILLFLSIPVAAAMPALDKSVVIQVIILTSLVMMIGSMLPGKEKPAAYGQN